MDVKDLIAKFTQKKVLVIGDIMLDEYISGSADRVSPEAPIPVLLQKSVSHVLGGAGNVAANAASLGAKVTLIGVVGKDIRAKTLAQLTKKSMIKSILIPDARPTTTKIRFVAGHHQLVRIDIEESHHLSAATEAAVCKAIESQKDFDAVLVSDYAKGAVTKKIMNLLKKKFGAKKITADMKPSQMSLYAGVNAITPNIKEVAEMTGIHAANDALATKAAKMLSQKLGVSVLLTRGPDGVTLCQKKGASCIHFRSRELSVKDVTGAGDTLIAVYALMSASGASVEESVEVANTAAGIVVGVGGTHALSHKTLSDQLSA